MLDAQFPGCCILGGGDARVKGKPFLVTESNNPYPSPFGSEYQPILHAYGAFQDWAGVFAYTWNCTTNAEPQAMEFYFSYAPRSDCVAHFPAVAALFLRGDVKHHRRRIDVNLPREVFADRLRSVGRTVRLQSEKSYAQCAKYLDSLGLSEAWMPIFEKSKEKTWDEKLYSRDVEFDGKTLHIVGL